MRTESASMVPKAGFARDLEAYLVQLKRKDAGARNNRMTKICRKQDPVATGPQHQKELAKPCRA
ncbi:hypothetical protein [Synechococcus sp. M16CYN]|uniref:hypothetical protein n=1 Tax=Synechococcus sp. M16CYN TaxID=3103139 RepID=UPI003250D866